MVFRYTGHIVGIAEVYAKTPITSQLETHDPGSESFIFTRTVVQPRAMPERDPCNKPEDAKKPQVGAVFENILCVHVYTMSGPARVADDMPISRSIS